MDKLYDVVKCLIQKLFPDAYILTCVSGKAANSKIVREKILIKDYIVQHWTAFVNIINEKFTSATTTKITEKVHSVQTFVKNAEKKII